MSQARTDFHGIFVNISVIGNEFKVVVDVTTQDRFPRDSSNYFCAQECVQEICGCPNPGQILVNISVIRNECNVFVDVTTQDRFPWDSSYYFCDQE